VEIVSWVAVVGVGLGGGKSRGRVPIPSVNQLGCINGALCGVGMAPKQDMGQRRTDKLKIDKGAFR